MLTVNCPNCGKQAVWQNNKYRPFCSERCKLIDFGNWANEKYSIENRQDSSNIESSSLEDNEQD